MYNHINQVEMVNLAVGLSKRNIEFSVHRLWDGLQIQCGRWDAICHSGSYGHENGLIEVMGLPQCQGDVIGYLTAKEVLDLVDDADYKPSNDTNEYDPYMGDYSANC